MCFVRKKALNKNVIKDLRGVLFYYAIDSIIIFFHFFSLSMENEKSNLLTCYYFPTIKDDSGDKKTSILETFHKNYFVKKNNLHYYPSCKKEDINLIFNRGSNF